jgi:hypothetical protein
LSLVQAAQLHFLLVIVLLFLLFLLTWETEEIYQITITILHTQNYFLPVILVLLHFLNIFKQTSSSSSIYAAVSCIV